MGVFVAANSNMSLKAQLNARAAKHNVPTAGY